MEVSDWHRNVQVYPIHQAMFRVIKDSENVDERQHCFLLQTVGRESRYFSMETRQDLLRLESAWHRTVCQAVSSIRVSFILHHFSLPFLLGVGEKFTPFRSCRECKIGQPLYAFTRECKI